MCDGTGGEVAHKVEGRPVEKLMHLQRQNIKMAWTCVVAVDHLRPVLQA